MEISRRLVGVSLFSTFIILIGAGHGIFTLGLLGLFLPVLIFDTAEFPLLISSILSLLCTILFILSLINEERRNRLYWWAISTGIVQLVFWAVLSFNDHYIHLAWLSALPFLLCILYSLFRSKIHRWIQELRS
ncbi:MAG: hypothetical protein K2P88_09890 [Chitinophagaceae bacterium]|uniref:hypothetical protein n=1 Tax=unclassified Paraflavitalea TaxID=2798305 RepID=UPI003D34AC9C|nr:hypothetical protein [Chitinophagaceae bacterium]